MEYSVQRPTVLIGDYPRFDSRRKRKVNRCGGAEVLCADTVCNLPRHFDYTELSKMLPPAGSLLPNRVLLLTTESIADHTSRDIILDNSSIPLLDPAKTALLFMGKVGYQL